MNTNTQSDLTQILDEIEERANKAQKGPWRFEQHWGPGNWQGAILGDHNFIVLPMETCTEVKDANGAFIASARTDLPALVKALRRAEEGFAKFAAEWADQDINLTASEALRDITAILNQGRKD